MRRSLYLAIIMAVGAGISIVGATDTVAAQLPTVLVTSQRETDVPSGDVYRSTRMGVLGNVDFMAAPMNSIGLTRQVLDMQAQPGRAFFDVVTRHPSVQVGGCSTDNNVELQVRGISYNLYDVLVDGMPGLMPMGSNSLNWLERVEVTAGANSALQGATAYRSASGVINLVPKRSEKEPFVKLTETHSGESIWTHALDVNAPVNDTFGIRVNGQLSKGDADTSREHIKHNNLFVSLDRRTDSSYTTLLAGYEDVAHHGMPEMLRVAEDKWGSDVTALPDPGRVIDNFMPSWSELSRTRKLMLVTHEQNVSKDLSAYVKWGYQSIDYPGYIDNKPMLQNDQGDYTLTLSGKSTQSRFLRHSLSVGLRGKMQTGSVEHRFTLGYDRLSSMNEWSKGKAGGTESTLQGNVYDATPLAQFAKPQIAPPNYYKGNDDVYRSFYAADYMTMADGRFHVLAGARHQTIDAMQWSRSKWLPTVGFVYRVKPNVSVYGMYAESMDTQSAPKDAANAYETLSPYVTRQYEVGVKAESDRLAGTVSLFRINRPQGIYTDQMIGGKKVFAMDGNARYQGMELNVFGRLTDALQIQGGVMWISTDMQNMTNPAINGKQAQGVAKTNATLGLTWRTPVSGLSVETRWQYVGASYADTMNRIRVPSWVRTDVGATYRFGSEKTPLTLRAMVYNVFDKKYWSTSVVKWGDRGVILNPGRTIMVSLSAQW